MFLLFPHNICWERNFHAFFAAQLFASCVYICPCWLNSIIGITVCPFFKYVVYLLSLKWISCLDTIKDCHPVVLCFPLSEFSLGLLQLDIIRHFELNSPQSVHFPWKCVGFSDHIVFVIASTLSFHSFLLSIHRLFLVDALAHECIGTLVLLLLKMVSDTALSYACRFSARQSWIIRTGL